jgi:ankyrin repeat protein
VNIPDCEGVRSTDIAVREGHWSAVKEFLEHDPDIRPEGTEILTNQLYEASETGDIEIVCIILKYGIRVNTSNKHVSISLHVAAKSGHKEIANLLLECGANVNTEDNGGQTPLILAAANCFVEIVRAL